MTVRQGRMVPELVLTIADEVIEKEALTRRQWGFIR
jgi:hypothetical protein